MVAPEEFSRKQAGDATVVYFGKLLWYNICMKLLQFRPFIGSCRAFKTSAASSRHVIILRIIMWEGRFTTDSIHLERSLGMQRTRSEMQPDSMFSNWAHWVSRWK